MIQKSILITKREAEVINKKLMNKTLTQQDSNYLSRYVRPKLREMSRIDSKELLSKLNYNQKVPAIERYIKSLILKNVKYVSSITIYGSAIYNNYSNYNDIDVLVAVKKKSWKKKVERALLEEKIAKMSKLKLDVKIYTEEYIYYYYPHDIVLIYGLKDSKTIYGILKYKKEVHIPKIYLKMHSDYSDLIIEDVKDSGLGYVKSKQLYSAIRNLMVIRLIIRGIIDNVKLVEMLNSELGKNIIDKLKNNSKSLVVKEIAYIYLKHSYSKIIKVIDGLGEDIVWGRSKK